MHLPSNTLLQGGKYKIIDKIGQGGFGIAYKAYHQGLQCEVCIKEFFFSDLCERISLYSFGWFLVAISGDNDEGFVLLKLLNNGYSYTFTQ